ncbi:MAG: hypothetical protein ACPGVZ_11470 [Myxococcota bacterium]
MQEIGSAGQTSLKEAVADAISVDDPLRRAARLADALQAFDERALVDIRDAWSLATGVSGAETVELALLAGWWGQYDPDDAFKWLNDRRRSSNPILVKALVRSWAARDPVAAGEALATTSKLREKDLGPIFFALAQGWNASGEPGVEAYLKAMSSDANRQVAISGLVADKVLRNGTEETIAWAEDLIEDGSDFKLRAFRRVAGAVADEDPLRAAAWAESRVDGPWGTGLVRPVAQHWARKDGRAAMEWLRGIPEAPDQARGFEDGYRAWLRNDREAARDWLLEQEIDALLDPVVAIYARSTARDDPAAAIPWVQRMHHDAARVETLEVVARAWAHHDRDAARAWIATSELDEDARNRIEEALQRSKERAQSKRERQQRAQGGDQARE